MTVFLVLHFEFLECLLPQLVLSTDNICLFGEGFIFRLFLLDFLTLLLLSLCDIVESVNEVLIFQS